MFFEVWNLKESSVDNWDNYSTSRISECQGETLLGFYVSFSLYSSIETLGTQVILFFNWSQGWKSKIPNWDFSLKLLRYSWVNPASGNINLEPRMVYYL